MKILPRSTQYMSKWTLNRLGITLAVLVLPSVSALAAPTVPNMIKILIEDMGWADSSTYG